MPVFLGMGLEQRVGNGVIAAQCQKLCTTGEDLIGMRLDRGADGFGVMWA